MFKPAAFLLVGALSACVYVLLAPGAVAATVYLAMSVSATVAVVAGIWIPFLTLAAVLFARNRRTAGPGIFMDAAIVGIAAAVISWHFLIEPLVDEARANPFSGGVAWPIPWQTR